MKDPSFGLIKGLGNNGEGVGYPKAVKRKRTGKEKGKRGRKLKNVVFGLFKERGSKTKKMEAFLSFLFLLF